MIMHGLFIIVIGIITLLLSIVTEGLSIDLTGFINALNFISTYIIKAFRVVQYLYSQSTWTSAIAFISAYIGISITISLIMLVINLIRGA